jgi:2-dehydro-3-deoxyphosphooctonate aldolase (KDO 8-P synthase)
MTNIVEIGKIQIGTGKDLALIAGPCVIESAENVDQIACRLLEICGDLGVPLIFKASFDKANRTSIDSYRGPGLKEGLKILADIKAKYDLPVLTDVHEQSQVDAVAEVVDVIQIPAFLSRQTDLLLAAAKTGRAVNVKKGQFMAPEDMTNAVNKLKAGGCRNILLTDRGTSFGYHNLVADMRGIPIMAGTGCPVIFDATHSVQRPAGAGSISGGDREFIPVLARAAVAAGCDALFMEVHPQPERGLSDAATMWPLEKLSDLLVLLREIRLLVM